MKYEINNFSFSEGCDYLDVDIHHEEKWIELKIETTDSFPIQSREELDMIYKKLCKVFDSFEDKKIDLERLHKDSKY
jgi:2-oxoglutarate dehydrogenase complex dehydrogenase (E1) component-like enzyme